MKTAPLLLISFFSFLSFCCYAQDNFLITGKSVGNIKIGDPQNEVLELLKWSQLEEVIWMRWYRQNSYMVSENGKPIMTITFYKDKVYGIEVYSDRYHTDLGLKVGYGFTAGN